MCELVRIDELAGPDKRICCTFGLIDAIFGEF
jgi:hypothetical protein